MGSMDIISSDLILFKKRQDSILPIRDTRYICNNHIFVVLSSQL